jgi:release factor glutamine methyltransferase
VRDEAERNAGVTVSEALADAEVRLAASGIDTARLDAELLAGKALGRSRTELYLDPERELAGGEEEAYRALVDRRALREPAAYILGEWGFRRLTLAVDPHVLIPRPGTESVVERCLELLRGIDTPEVLDAGTGSGAIALAIADEHPGARVTAIDASKDALTVARANAARAGLDVRLLLHDLGGDLGGPFDLVVSNPPYVFEHELPGLQPELRFEPEVALVDRGQTEAVAQAARAALRPGGSLVLEVGDERGLEVAGMLRDLGYGAVAVGQDLTGRDRVVEGRWTP